MTTTIDLEALITAACEAREVERRREEEKQERHQREREAREVSRFWAALNEEEEHTFWTHLDVTVEYQETRMCDDVYQAWATFSRYGERFILRFHGQDGWSLRCPSHWLTGQRSDHDRDWPNDMVSEWRELAPRLLAYLGDVRRYVAALTAHEDAAQSADQARHDEEGSQ